jgi:hypothetical protein
MKLYWLFQPGDTPQGPWLLPPDHFQGLGHIQPGDFADPAFLATVQGDASLTEFRGTDGPQDKPEEPGPHRVIWRVTSAADALSAIAQIAAQGEGTTNEQNSHFWEFLDLYNGFTTFADPAGRSPVLNVPTNPTAASLQGIAKLWAQLFNTRYQMLLQKLPLALVQPKNTNSGPAGRDTLIENAIDQEMLGNFGVRGLAKRLMALPGVAAGPPFELPEAALPQNPDGQKQFLIQLLDQSKSLIAQALTLQGPDALSQPEKDDLQRVQKDDNDLRQALSGP